MFKKISSIFFITFCLTSVVFAECGKFKVQWINFGKTIKKTETICVNGNLAFSKDCNPLLLPTCPFSSIKKDKPLRELIQPIGSPGFNLCHILNSSPQMYEIYVDNNWKKFERCFWKKTNSFVDVSELIDFYKTLR